MSHAGESSCILFSIAESLCLRACWQAPPELDSVRILGHANQNSDTVVQFKVDQSTGTLTPTGQPIQVPKPVCVLFVKV